MGCEKCNGTGWLPNTWENGYEYGNRCDCVKIQIQEARVERSGLKKRLNSNTFENFTTPESWQKYILQQAQDFIKSQEGWFYIGGKSGTGKTHICIAICAELMKTRAVKYVSWRDMARSLKAGANSEDYLREMEGYMTAEVLYLDDFFKGNVTDGDINIASELINHRYNNELMTIISSELTLSEITMIDEAVGSRIYQLSTARIALPADIVVNYRTSGGKVQEKQKKQ